MVVKIKPVENLRKVLNYNEHKINTGKAELILASRFGCELEELGFYEKLYRLQQLNDRNQHITKKTIHIFLSFSPQDQLDTEKMQQIAWDYMSRIGFSKQPYLVYKHTDTTHTHLHIVTSSIKPDGRQLNLSFIGIRKSEPARKAMEQEYNLVIAEGRGKTKQHQIPPADIHAAMYGEKETKSELSRVVEQVVAYYHFTSLEELNLILAPLQVIADPGREGSRIREHGGLTYSLLNEEGKKDGQPIKASSFHFEPTLKNLQEKFDKELNRRYLYTGHAKKVVAAVLPKSGRITEDQFIQALAKRKIQCRIVKNEEGRIQQVQLVDHFKKTALSDKDIGLSVELLGEKLTPAIPTPGEKIDDHIKLNQGGEPTNIPRLAITILKDMLAEDNRDTGVSNEFLKKKKKKRKSSGY